MRIGLTGGGSSADKIVQQAQQAEAEGFTSLWYASSVAGDPLVPMAIAGRVTTSIELVQRYCGPNGWIAGYEGARVRSFAPPRTSSGYS